MTGQPARLAVKLALDTNAYRRFAEGDRRVLDLLQVAEGIALPIPVVAELRAGFALGTTGRQNERGLSRFLDSPAPLRAAHLRRRLRSPRALPRA